MLIGVEAKVFISYCFFIYFVKLKSEFMDNSRAHVENLLAFSLGIIEGKNGSELYKKYYNDITNVNAKDVIEVIDRLVRKNIETEELKKGLNKIFNVFYKSLINAEKKLPAEKTFLYWLVKENDELDRRLKQIRPFIKQVNRKDLPAREFDLAVEQLKKRIKDLKNFESHYVKKENILFPCLETYWDNYRCIQVMWSYHDDIREVIKQTLSALDSEDLNLKNINHLLGDLFFTMYAIRFREENVLFPVALETVDEKLWEEMVDQSYNIGFSFIETPVKEKKRLGSKRKHKFTEDMNGVLDNIDLQGVKLDLDTGQVDLEQIITIFNTLPVDLTFVDKNNKVRFFSAPADRIFPRSKAIIGRDVENCHPPESVHVVKKIIKDFKAGEKEKASFRIETGGKFILIQYFALFDSKRQYLGVLEVSQDVTEIRNLKGEKRLLDWGK